MNEQIDHLARKLLVMYDKIPPHQRLIVSISGIPGSGKSTLASAVTSQMNRLLHPSHHDSQLAVSIPMDGYHFSRAQLDTFQDPKMAHARRGAAFTFDAASLLLLLKNLREPLSTSTPTIYAPSFSHILKDPIENDIAISSSSRILIFEGNYLAMNLEPWLEIAKLFNERWFLDVDFETAEKRLISRHIASGIEKSEEDARRRAQENDLVNGRQILNNQFKIDEVVISKQTNDF